MVALANQPPKWHMKEAYNPIVPKFLTDHHKKVW